MGRALQAYVYKAFYYELYIELGVHARKPIFTLKTGGFADPTLKGVKVKGT